ncbi:hypothetical protein C8R48DRAFT_450682 [Suillus tomentosus]|nr:hypothetical protein C8R48DRAFT_450682 [Suillus tomentosus]
MTANFPPFVITLRLAPRLVTSVAPLSATSPPLILTLALQAFSRHPFMRSQTIPPSGLPSNPVTDSFDVLESLSFPESLTSHPAESVPLEFEHAYETSNTSFYCTIA